MAYNDVLEVDSSIDLLNYTVISAVEDLIEARMCELDRKLNNAETVAEIDSLQKERYPLIIAQKRFDVKIREYEDKARLAPQPLTV